MWKWRPWEDGLVYRPMFISHTQYGVRLLTQKCCPGIFFLISFQCFTQCSEGNKFFKGGEFAAAIEKYKLATSVDPNVPAYWWVVQKTLGSFVCLYSRAFLFCSEMKEEFIRWFATCLLVILLLNGYQFKIGFRNSNERELRHWTYISSCSSSIFFVHAPCGCSWIFTF